MGMKYFDKYKTREKFSLTSVGAEPTAFAYRGTDCSPAYRPCMSNIFPYLRQVQGLHGTQ